jgi:hypothetical protein
MHAPDAFEGGTFSALHRYRAMGDYDAQFLAVWEGDAGSLDEVRSRMGLRTRGAPDRSRISPALIVVWSGFHFRNGQTGRSPEEQTDGPGRAPVGTMTLLEGPRDRLVDATTPPTQACYDYNDIMLVEDGEAPGQVQQQWAGRGSEGIAPHGPYRNIFDHPDEWPPVAARPTALWISHWEPLSSQRRGD